MGTVSPATGDLPKAQGCWRQLVLPGGPVRVWEVFVGLERILFYEGAFMTEETLRRNYSPFD